MLFTGFKRFDPLTRYPAERGVAKTTVCRKGESGEKLDYLMLTKEIKSNNPGSTADNFINISTMSQGLVTFFVRHNSEPLQPVCLLVARGYTMSKDYTFINYKLNDKCTILLTYLSRQWNRKRWRISLNLLS